jgi:hypothetical protein
MFDVWVATGNRNGKLLTERHILRYKAVGFNEWCAEQEVTVLHVEKSGTASHYFLFSTENAQTPFYTAALRKRAKVEKNDLLAIDLSGAPLLLGGMG